MSNNGKTDVSLKNILAIGGFIILLVIGIWSAIQVISYIPRLFSSTGVEEQTPATGGITAHTTTNEAASGEDIAITWSLGEDAEDGVVSFSYACQDGFYFETAGEPVPCNLPYTLEDGTEKLMLTPVLVDADIETLEVPFAMTYTNGDGESIRDTHTLTVTQTVETNAAVTTSTTGAADTEEGTAVTTPVGLTITPARQSASQTSGTSQTGSTGTQYTGYSDPYGTPDLAVTLVSVGAVDSYGIYHPTYAIQSTQRGAFVFAVTNRGTKATGPWYFNAQLPIQGGYPLFSEAQASLLPGARVEIRVAFDQLSSGAQAFSVVVDPRNFIAESNEYNNTINSTFPVTGLYY